MARIFITGSADGLGQMAAILLLKQGHKVVMHARTAERAQQAMEKNPGAENVLIADLSDMEATKNLAALVNALGPFDAVIHNAGVYRASNDVIFAVNSLAPYILTCLIHRPDRLVYLSSGMHLQGNSSLGNLSVSHTACRYSDSKLQVLILAKAVASRWPNVYANAVDPGWVPTKMGGPGAPDNLQKGVDTQTWLAVSNEAKTKVSGRYFFHKAEAHSLAAADANDIQDKYLALCEAISGVHLPGK